ncbi:MAG: hypothetical protein ABSD44_15440 [Terracidiphilus sp.]
MNDKTALERHDSALEEQERRQAGCDLDHFSLIELASRGSVVDKFPKRGAQFPSRCLIRLETAPL